MTATPTDLARIQDLVMRASTQKDALPKDPAMVLRASRVVAGSARLSPVEQLDIYREQFWARHVHSLQEDFAIALHLLGEGGFFDLIAAYLAEIPPRSFDLRRLGAKLPAFAASHEPWQSDALLCESMRLDWAYMAAFDALDVPPFDPQSIASAGEDEWPHATLALHPSVYLLALAYPLLAMREALRRGETPARPEPAAEHLVVYRQGEWLHCLCIESMAFELLEALSRGVELGAACEHAATSHGIADAEALAPKVGEWFQQWTASGWVSEVRFVST
jgi:hypothetical protein